MIRARTVVATITGVAVTLAVAGGSWAAEEKPKVLRGLYAGGGVGVAQPNDRGSETAWRLDVWLRAMRYFSLQLGYADLGDGGGSGNGDVDGVTFSAVPQFPIGDWLTLHGKVGVMSATVDNDTQTELTFGAGASVELPYKVGIRAEWEHYNFDHQVNAAWLSLYYHFATF